MDQLKALQVFRAVAKEGGLAAAARRLGLSPPSVTRIINELEDHLGTPLLHRSTRAIHLTDIGRAYLADAERILDDLRAANEAAQGAHARPRGTLRLTSSVLFGQYYIAPIIGEYIERFPEVRVDAVFLDRNVSLIDEGFDLAVRIGALPDSSLRAIRVGRVRLVVCGSPAYFERHGIPSHPDDLKRHRIIQFTGTPFAEGSWSFDNGLTAQFEPRMMFSSIAACIAMARAGHGLARVLTYQVGPAAGIDDLRIVLEDHSTNEWPIHLIHPEHHGHSAKVRAFLDIAVDRLRADPSLK